MNVCIFGMGMFGFPIANHIAKNKEFGIFAYEKDQQISTTLKNTRKHPYFFTDVELATEVEIIQEYENILPEMDIILLIIPYQFIRGFIAEIRPYLKENVLIVNLSKGINNMSFTTAGDDIASSLGRFSYRYAVLSGGMIAQDLVDDLPLGVDIATSHKNDEAILRRLFAGPNLDIEMSQGDTKMVELAGALKNVLALATGYYEGKGYSASSLGRVIVGFYREIELLLPRLGWVGNYPFARYSVGGDIIATCFGNSRNRYLGKLVGSGLPLEESMERLKNEKKIAEGYYTLIGLGQSGIDLSDCPQIRSLIKSFT